MALIFVQAYQHHDNNVLNPVRKELNARGHNLLDHWPAFLGFRDATGPKALLLVADILTFDHSEGLALVKQSRWAGIPSISIQHGIPFGVGKEVIPTCADVYCIWGEYWKDGYNSPTHALTGNPVFDKIPDYDISNARYTVTKNHGDGPKALLVSSFAKQTRNNEIDDLSLDDRFDMYLNEANESGWDGVWLVRPHPSDLKFEGRMELHQKLIEALPRARLQSHMDLPLFDVLASVDLVMGTSTVLYEAMAFGCKVRPLAMGVFNNDMPREEIFYPWPLDGGSAARIADVVEAKIDEHF